MLVTLATRTFTPEPTAAALRLGALVRSLVSSGASVRVLTSRLAPSVARDGARAASRPLGSSQSTRRGNAAVPGRGPTSSR